MTAGTELLRAALAGGDDERHVYADWLEQRGDPLRAQVIHLQCERARHDRWDRRHLELGWELDAVLAELGDRWRDELPALPGVEWIALDRGFASAVRVADGPTLYRYADAIAAAASVSRVELARLDPADDERPLPWLRAVRVDVVTAPTANHPLLGTPEVELREFDLGWFPGTPIERISILDNSEVGSELVDALVGCEWAKELRALELPSRWIDDDSGYAADPRLGADGARELVKLAKLERVNVDRQRVGTAAFARLFALAGLRELSARECGVTKLDGIVKHDRGARLVHLDLSRNAFGDAGAAALGTASRLDQVRSLVLDTCEVGATGLARLVGSTMWHQLRLLDLSRNPLGGGGVRALVEAEPPEQLHTLRIADADIDDTAQLARVSWLRALSVLDLTGNPLGHGAIALRSIEPGALRDLGLASTGMGRTEAAGLARFWPTLVRLDLAGNPLTDAGLERFATMKEAAELQVLRLADCQLGDDGLELLAARARTPRLRELVLANNPVTVRGLERLLVAPCVRALVTLDLSRCELAADAIAVLAVSPPPRLRRLVLRGNPLDERTLLRLADAEALRDVAIEADGEPWRYHAATATRLQTRFGDRWYVDRGER